MYFVHDPGSLILSMTGVGLAWGSMLTIPYAILAGSLPAGKIGVYIGLFNIFIAFPQIVNGVIGGPVLHIIYDDHAIYALVISGIFMLCGAISVLWVHDKGELRLKNQHV
jgi:maltose/moltooligosaccharide transporter